MSFKDFQNEESTTKDRYGEDNQPPESFEWRSFVISHVVEALNCGFGEVVGNDFTSQRKPTGTLTQRPFFFRDSYCFQVEEQTNGAEVKQFDNADNRHAQEEA
jgi:hypothetical protein